MSDWADINWYIHLGDHHTEADANRLILQIKDWARNDDGYAENILYEPQQRVVWCGYVGECGYTAEAEIITYLSNLALRETIDITLEWKSDDTQENCTHFGPNAGRRRINDALQALHDPIQAMVSNQDALTAQLCQSIANTANHLLELIRTADNAQPPKLPTPISQDIAAAQSALNALACHLLEQIEQV